MRMKRTDQRKRRQNSGMVNSKSKQWWSVGMSLNIQNAKLSVVSFEEVGSQ